MGSNVPPITPTPPGGEPAAALIRVTLAINPGRAAADRPRATAPPARPCRPQRAVPCPPAAPGPRRVRRAPRGGGTPDPPPRAARRRVSRQAVPFGIHNRRSTGACLPFHPAPAGSRGTAPARREAPQI